VLQRLRLSTRISLIGILTTLCFACALPWIHFRIRDAYYEAKWEKTTQLVHAAWGALDYYGKQVDAGAMTKERAQDAAKRTVRNLRYGADFQSEIGG
jgi:hypothetical protein